MRVPGRFVHPWGSTLLARLLLAMILGPIWFISRIVAEPAAVGWGVGG